jgi:N-acetylglucosaminyldiphosphoundecaprenol N-acetyl-beta-D-mannosaminyltransferase
MALHLGYGGIEQYISSLTMMLKEEYNIEIISTYKIMEEPAFNFENVNITYLLDDKPNKEELKNSIKCKNIFKILKEGLKAANIIYQKKYLNGDKIENINSKYIITTRDFHNELVGIYGRNDIIKIATEHNYHNNDEKYIKKVINSVKDIDYFILVSEILKDFYNDKVNPKCLFIPNVIDNLPNKSSNCKKHNLISIGRLSKEKGQKDLIDVVALLKEKYKDIKLYLVGDGPEKNELNKYIKENKLSKNVELTGFLNKNDIELKILNSSIFVTTSYTESFGLVVIEACSYKLPVVAFDSATGVKKLLENKNGILVQNRDKKQMAKEISRLFEDEKLKEKISENGYKSCQQYLAKNVKKKWMNIIK